MSVPPSLDWHAVLFQPDGDVDAAAARAWVATAHTCLRRHYGAAWTDAQATWLGRLCHDCLHYQGTHPGALTADDLDDLLLTLTVAQRDRAPAPPEALVPALRQLYRYGAQVHGSLAARDAAAFLDDDLEQAFLEAFRAAPDPAEAEESDGAEPEEDAPQSRSERRAREGGAGRKRVKVKRKTGRRKRKGAGRR